MFFGLKCPLCTTFFASAGADVCFFLKSQPCRLFPGAWGEEGRSKSFACEAGGTSVRRQQSALTMSDPWTSLQNYLGSFSFCEHGAKKGSSWHPCCLRNTAKDSPRLSKSGSPTNQRGDISPISPFGNSGQRSAAANHHPHPHHQGPHIHAAPVDAQEEAHLKQLEAERQQEHEKALQEAHALGEKIGEIINEIEQAEKEVKEVMQKHRKHPNHPTIKEVSSPLCLDWADGFRPIKSTELSSQPPPLLGVACRRKRKCASSRRKGRSSRTRNNMTLKYWSEIKNMNFRDITTATTRKGGKGITVARTTKRKVKMWYLCTGAKMQTCARWQTKIRGERG
jgi:hypothetical protein